MLLRPKNSRKGIAAVEMAVMAPVLVFLMLGLWEVGRYISMQNLLDNAAREGGRLGASGAYFSSNQLANAKGPLTLPAPSKNASCELQQRVLLYLQVSGLSTTGATVTVTNATKNWTCTYTAGNVPTPSGSPTYDPTAAAGQLDQLTVTVNLPYSNGSWLPRSWFISPSTVMAASATWNSMADVPLIVSTTIPTKPIQPTDPLP